MSEGWTQSDVTVVEVTGSVLVAALKRTDFLGLSIETLRLCTSGAGVTAICSLSSDRLRRSLGGWLSIGSLHCCTYIMVVVSLSVSVLLVKAGWFCFMRDSSSYLLFVAS